MNGKVSDRVRGAPRRFAHRSIEEFTDDLKGASLSGTIAAAGAVANSGVGLLKGWAWMPLNLLTNQIAASTAGALGVSRGDGLAINSMGIGSFLSMAAFIPIDGATRAGRLDESVKKIVTIMANTPTEILSLATGIFAANHIRLGELMTTDAGQRQRMVELIASKAIARLNHPQQAAGEITEQELQAIEHPALALTFPAGKAIVGSINGVVEGLNGVVDFLSHAWAAARSTPADHARDAARPSREMPGIFPVEV